MSSTPEAVAKAIATIEFSRNTHVEWAAYMRGHNDCVCDCGKPHPDVNNLGDAAYHENCIAEYDNVLAVLKTK
jgi:hypothetical protein